MELLGVRVVGEDEVREVSRGGGSLGCLFVWTVDGAVGSFSIFFFFWKRGIWVLCWVEEDCCCWFS